MKINLHHERRQYTRNELLEHEALQNPFEQFAAWFKDATNEPSVVEPNVMTLATATVQAKPSVRILLLKEFSAEGFVFYTNYGSRKGRELAQNPQASLLFFWEVLERQVRIDGVVKKVDAKLSDEYFESRPLESRIGAIASPQSEVVASREELSKRIADVQASQNFARPQHWGGYILVPDYFEFWQGRPNRVHDRLAYTAENGVWKTCRLAP